MEIKANHYLTKIMGRKVEEILYRERDQNMETLT